MTSVSAGWREAQERVAQACARARRTANSVELLAVSKLKPEAALREAYAAGARQFGENYAQELRDKARAMADLPGLIWHAIGPLQKNKAKYVAQSATFFHALDRFDVAEELSRRRVGAPLLCYLEVNLGAEHSKGGVPPNEVAALLSQVQALSNLTVVGLMSLPPQGATPEASRPYFQQLRALAAGLGLPGLSMGTSADFEVAIEEGATVVRVGTLIFSARGT